MVEVTLSWLKKSGDISNNTTTSKPFFLNIAVRACLKSANGDGAEVTKRVPTSADEPYYFAKMQLS